MKLLGQLMDILGWTAIWYAIAYIVFQVGYALMFSPALREVIK